MTTQAVVTLLAYFKIHAGKGDELRANCEKIVALGEKEGRALSFAYSFDGDEFVSREDYADADAVLAHMEDAKRTYEGTLAITELTRAEVHGPESELRKLREPFAPFSPRYFATEFVFRR